MRSNKGWYSLLSLVVVFCLVAVPVGAFGKKGRDHYNRGLDYELAQQWDKAAQEFTLALAADPSNVDYQLHYRRAVFNASQTFMQQGRALAEQRDYVGAYNAFRQAFGYDPVNQLAVSEMERMLRLQEVKEGGKPATTNDGAQGDGSGTGTPATPGTAKPQEQVQPIRQEANRSVIYNGADLKTVIRTLADQLSLNVIFDRQSFAQPRQVDINLHNVTTAKALDFIFLQEGLFFQKLDRHTILVAEQGRRPQYQQLVVRTFYIANADPEKVQNFISKALPASVGRPQSIVVFDKDTNSLTVRDTAENVQLIGELIAAVDKDRAEVVMDVNIYEVNRSDLMQFGNQLGQGTFNLGGSPGVAVLSNNGVRTAAEHGVNLSNVIGASPTGLAAALIIPPSVFQAFESKSNGRLLAATQVHAFNNEESTARIGQRVPVQTAQAYPFGIQTGTPNPGNVFPSGGFPVINYEPTGLTLSFTPQVFPNLDVQVKMKIESKDVTGANTLTPTFTERTITGTARVQNNRTMMLASVSTEVTANGRQGLPVLGGLPWLGRLFTAPTKDNRQVDIVIAVTPRVLRAPAVTPRDEEMRPSGTLQAPTTGSLEAMMEQTAREEQQIAAARAHQNQQLAAARQIPKDVTVQLPDAPVTYEPATNVSTNQTVNVAQTQTVPPQTQPANLTASTSQAQADSAMPQPKTTAVANNTNTEQKPNAVSTNTATEPKTDVSTAINRLVSPGNSVSTTSATSKDQPAVTSVVDRTVAPTTKTDANVNAADSAPTLIELGLAPDKSEMTVGEKRQIAVNLRATTPLSLAVVSLRFDPKVLKVGSISAGKLFANGSAAPMITQSIDPNGMLLVSIAPATGSQVTGEGSLLNIEFEAIGAGNSGLAFDISNVHVVPADGHPTTLQVDATTLTVKEADGPPPPKPVSNPTSSNQSPATKFEVAALAVASGLSQSWIP